MKILIVGGVAGGASCAARIRRLDEKAEIIIFEQGPDVSFSNCALPYYLSNIIDNRDKLVLMNPSKFKNQYNIEVRTNSKVVSIDRENRKIKVIDIANNNEYFENYDKLVLATGASPFIPNTLQGADKENVFTIRNVVDIEKLKKYLVENNVKNVSVVGGGFIGLEVVENLVEAKYNVSLVEMSNQVLPTIDYDLVQIVHKELLDHNVNLVLNDGIKEIEDGYIELNSGKQIVCEAVVLAIGVKPETSLAKDCDLEIGQTGGIKVNNEFKTSDENIYAVGDVVEITNKQTGKQGRLALAWPAQMQARIAANDICGAKNDGFSYIGSSVVKLFDKYIASTGMNEKALIENQINYDYVYVIPQDKVSIMPNSKPIHLKVLFEKVTGKVLGAQCISQNNADRRIDVISTVIHFNGTLYDLKNLELCYAPVVSTAKDAVNYAGLVGVNILENVYKQVHLSDIEKLVNENAYIVDVREEAEYQAGHIINAVNIPLSQLRQRINEIPKDKNVYLHCRSSQRSYNALMCLQNNGFTNVYNISGSYLAISYYLYANDILQNRKPILTAYNFK